MHAHHGTSVDAPAPLSPRSIPSALTLPFRANDHFLTCCDVRRSLMSRLLLLLIMMMMMMMDWKEKRRIEILSSTLRGSIFAGEKGFRRGRREKEDASPVYGRSSLSSNTHQRW
ncbi:hypothetical protein BDZ90DRAFT_158846 [Jaminaea rosea]|uniref:Uncharacterized protein n=1 Tax=Jaminaea rosea TaxID=1569628 RepID=A0A316USL5_9BASI|nr:hypothetical protein BDZ90DRAFT_158846 [Jaminaea rosea]PWN27984.1 hypothetical protein BDZ90DRAFT_158846 [Jaminaea rosea]